MSPTGGESGPVALRPYQQAAIAAVFDAFRRGVHRQLVVMATGLGKTIVVGGLAARSGWGAGRRMFGIMHREELIEQARQRLAHQNPGRMIDYEKAAHRAADGVDIVLASVQTVGRGDGRRLLRFQPDDFSKVWIDEVHHAPARSYVSVLRHFGLFENPGTPKLLIGTTATPERLDRLGYDHLFDDVVYRYGLREGITDRWLADLACYRVSTNVDLSGVRVRAGEFVESDLARAVDIQRRNETCLRVEQEHARGRRNLVFCVTKDHARHVAALFEQAGVRAGVVVEDTPRPERLKTVEAFREGRLEVLVNVSVFTEGFDVPEVEAVHLLRPTRSTALLLQMIGRGTRRTPSKDRCMVFDYADDLEGKDLATIAGVFGLPSRFDFKGHSATEQVEAIEAIESELGGLPILEDVSSLDELELELTRVDFLKLYATVAPEAEDISDLRWRRKVEDHLMIAWRNRTAQEVAAAGEARWAARERATLTQRDLFGVHERLEVQVNQLGMWEVLRTADRPAGPQAQGPLAWPGPARGAVGRDTAGPARERLALERSMRAAIAYADRWIRTERPHIVHLLDRTAPWNHHPATQPQIDALARKGYPQKMLLGITKGEAAILMNKPVPRFLKPGAGPERAAPRRCGQSTNTT